METFSEKDLKKLNSKKGLLSILFNKTINLPKTIRYIDYEKQLKVMQTELIRQQTCIIDDNMRVIVIFEGRDAAGKGGAIRRITERINPRHYRIVALPKPTEVEQSPAHYL